MNVYVDFRLPGDGAVLGQPGAWSGLDRVGQRGLAIAAGRPSARTAWGRGRPPVAHPMGAASLVRPISVGPGNSLRRAVRPAGDFRRGRRGPGAALERGVRGWPGP